MAAASSSGSQDYDAEQVQFMVEDMCIVTTEDDEPLRPGSKDECHRNANIEKGLLHRAFSVFLFDSQHRLLLQQRSSKKITFPDMWTNTVCSHPLANQKDESSGVEGVKVAAQRKLQHELNIPPEQVPLENFHFLSRIHYKARSDETWGEHEIDYILFIQADNVSVDPNPGEAQAIRYVSISEVQQLVEDAKQGKVLITPWFHLIFDQFLVPWWQQLKDNKPLPSDSTIHRL